RSPAAGARGARPAREGDLRPTKAAARPAGLVPERGCAAAGDRGLGRASRAAPSDRRASSPSRPDDAALGGSGEAAVVPLHQTLVERGHSVLEGGVHAAGDVDRPRMWGLAARVGNHRNAACVRVPRLHRRALVGRRERREDRVARLDVGEISLDDLCFPAFRTAAEVAPHRIDGLPAGGSREPGGPSAILVGERRPGQVDARHGSTLDRVKEEFVALGHAGSDAYVGLETFPNPGVESVGLVSDGVTAVCPTTNLPDFDPATIEYRPVRLCLESKSLKIYLSRFREQGAFCEALAVQIRDEVATVLELAPDRVRVSLRQKARGGITITATT